MKFYKEYLKNVLPCLAYGMLCGLVTGGGIFLFRLAAGKAEILSRFLYRQAVQSPLGCVLILLALVGMALVMTVLHKTIPESKGGGIPRSEGVLRGILSFRWLKTLIGTVVGSMISYVCGIPVGSEGPAVLIGTSIGSVCTGRNHSAWKRYVMTGGAGAGFAVATGAPLSGILFALEEIHKRFTPMLVMTVSVSVVTASCFSRFLCTFSGMSPQLFHFEPFAGFSLSHVGYLFLFGILTALAVGVFDVSIGLFGYFSKKKKKIPASVKLIAVFLLTGIGGLFFADSIYSGHDVIHNLFGHDYSILYPAALFVIRLLLMLLVTDSGVTGGIFIPTLAVGALASAVSAKLLLAAGISEELYTALVLLGMCAFIGGTLRAPLTAAVLFVELTGQVTDLFYAALVIFTVNAVTELLHQTPFYDRALENIEHEEHKGRTPVIAHFSMKVSERAFVVGKTVRDIMWPPSSVVIGITRADEQNEDMDNDGEKKLYAGDTIILRAKYFDEEEIRAQLAGLIGEEKTIMKVQKN